MEGVFPGAGQSSGDPDPERDPERDPDRGDDGPHESSDVRSRFCRLSGGRRRRE